MSKALVPLKTLAQEIQDEHLMCEQAAESAVQHAIKCGELLAEAKAQVAHGEWLPWLGENFEFTRETSALYVRLAQKCKDDPTFRPRTIEEGRAELAEPREPEGDKRPGKHASDDITAAENKGGRGKVAAPGRTVSERIAKDARVGTKTVERVAAVKEARGARRVPA